MGLNVQHFLEARGLGIGNTTELSTGLLATIDNIDPALQVCDNIYQETAIRGLVSVTQGAVIVLRGVNMVPLGVIVAFGCEEIGLKMAYKDLGAEQILAMCGLTIEDVMYSVSNEILTGLVGAIGANIGLELLQWGELVGLWFRLKNSRLVYVIRERYESTEYSMVNGLDTLINMG